MKSGAMDWCPFAATGRGRGAWRDDCYIACLGGPRPVVAVTRSLLRKMDAMDKDEDLLVEDDGCHGSSLGRWWSTILIWCSGGVSKSCVHAGQILQF
ncbi:hypothetical protein ACLOJK_026955 [Asimina triloba]